MRTRMGEVLVLCCLLSFLPVRACPAADGAPAKIDAKTVALSNKVMHAIFQDILKVKGEYPELKDFDQRALTRNKEGIYKIEYTHRANPDDPEDASCAFGLTIDGMSDVTFSSHRGAFNFGFPVLGVKFSGYQGEHLLRSQYDIFPEIRKNGVLLEDRQQALLPLRLTLEPVKRVYLTQEDIEFDVVLTNASKRNMIVKDLGKDTLFFLINNQYWGTTPESGARSGKTVILSAGQSIRRRFKGTSFQFPKKVEIFCVYRMSIDGVNPSARIQIDVVNPS